VDGKRGTVRIDPAVPEEKPCEKGRPVFKGEGITASEGVDLLVQRKRRRLAAAVRERRKDFQGVSCLEEKGASVLKWDCVRARFLVYDAEDFYPLLIRSTHGGKRKNRRSGG